MIQEQKKDNCTIFHLTTNTKQRITVHLTCSPKSASIEEFSRSMKDKAITDVFCFCKPQYDKTFFESIGLKYHNLEFPDGTAPGSETLEEFNQIFDQIVKRSIEHDVDQYVDTLFEKRSKPQKIKIKTPKNETIVQKDIVINMHCQSGLGRAPTMLAYIMITRCNFDNIEAVNYVRKHKKGTFNTKQIDWIISSKLKFKDKKDLCALM